MDQGHRAMLATSCLEFSNYRLLCLKTKLARCLELMVVILAVTELKEIGCHALPFRHSEP